MKRFIFRQKSNEVNKLRKKTLVTGLLVSLILGIGGYMVSGNAQSDIQALYPRSPETFVGDPMPYYDGNSFKMYYLEDLRDGQIGYHPFSLMETTDFYNYTDYGEVIPFVNEEDSAERALGTGSIIQDEEGIYHAFYTGHNQQRSPKEVIMHATSEDGITFDKIPENTFEGDDMYEKDDFRDPFVFWEEESQLWWMLITTRQDGEGVIAKYTSDNLNKWENDGVFFKNDLGNDSNLECPSLVHFDGKWYLAFSDQWDQRVVHYRIANDVNGPFEAPEEAIDYFDGAGFYAGRLETDGANLYMVGWIPTKERHDDLFRYNWAGNLAVHQLHAEDDKLIPALPKSAYNRINKTDFPARTLSSGESVEFEDENSTLFEGHVEIKESGTKVALQFSDNNNIIINVDEEKMYYVNADLDSTSQRDPVTDMQLSVGESGIDLQIVKENGIVVLYANDVAFSNRIYDSIEKPFSLLVLEGEVHLSSEKD